MERTRDGRLVPPSALAIAWASFGLIGWTGLLVPSLVREIEVRFGVDDAALGTWYLVNATVYAGASFAGGLLTERIGRRNVLVVAAASLAVGLTVIGVAGAWPWLLLAGVPLGLGAGAIDGGMNGLVLAVVDDRRGRALNLLHLCFAVGALSAPAVVGLLLERGVAWQPIFLATGGVAVLVALGLARAHMPSGRRTPDPAAPTHPSGPGPSDAGRGEDGRREDGRREDGRNEDGRRDQAAPPRSSTLALLALAIGCYVAAEVGVSSWIVRFLDRAPVAEATLALSGFWAGLALARLLAARVSDRFPATAFAAAAALLAGVFVVAAVVAPSIDLSAVGFALAGFASGPVFPMIMAAAGERFPDRLSAATGTLTAAAVVGGTVYPPLVGFASSGLGIGTGLLGAAGLSLLSGISILVAGRASSR